MLRLPKRPAPRRTVTRSIELDAPAEVVWDALTDPALAAEWLGAEPERCVTAAEEHEHLSFIWEREEGPSRVDFRLDENEDGATALTVTETALSPAASAPAGGEWTRRLESLRLCLASLAYA